MTDLIEAPPIPAEAEAAVAPPGSPRRRGLVRRVAMRPRKVLVLVHRWLSLVLLAWVVIVALTGAWLAVHHEVEHLWQGDRFHSTDGDVGPDAAVEAAQAALPEGSEAHGLTLPVNSNGVYAVYGEGPHDDEAVPFIEPDYYEVFVDPGTGEVNEVWNSESDTSWWLYRGHMYLWQDQGIGGVFNPEHGWCAAGADGHEPGGVKGVVCDVIPDGMDLVAWMGVGFIVILLGGFYLWYWPGVKRWASALTIRRGRGRFTFHMSLHKVIGFVFWVPLLVVAFTGIAFAFPNLNSWYENATPAQRDFALWTPPEGAISGDPAGREPIGLDRAREIFEEQYPERTLHYMDSPYDETGTYMAWMSRGFDPWTREGGAGNTYVALDQYTGDVLYDGPPSEGNVFDQAWDDWSFPLHTGDFGNTPTRFLWVAVGISPVVLGCSGLIMYLVRRGKRKKRAMRSQESALEGG